MRRLGTLVIAIVVLAGCEAAGQPRTFPGGRPAEIVSDACARTFAPLRAALINLDQRLGVGLTRDEHRRWVDLARTTRDATAPGPLDAACREVAGRLDRALAAYVEAADEWDGCIEDADCDTVTLQRNLQAHWAAATELLIEVGIVWPG